MLFFAAFPKHEGHPALLEGDRAGRQEEHCLRPRRPPGSFRSSLFSP